VKITKKEEKFSEYFLKDAIGKLKSIIEKCVIAEEMK
jgi:hypothetical protein